jgi:hypothetical protein
MSSCDNRHVSVSLPPSPGTEQQEQTEQAQQSLFDDSARKEFFRSGRGEWLGLEFRAEAVAIPSHLREELTAVVIRDAKDLSNELTSSRVVAKVLRTRPRDLLPLLQSWTAPIPAFYDGAMAGALAALEDADRGAVESFARRQISGTKAGEWLETKAQVAQRGDVFPRGRAGRVAGAERAAQPPARQSRTIRSR